LSDANIIEWFPLIVLYRPEQSSKILEALINQIILSQGFEDIDIPSECLYCCLMAITSEESILQDVGRALSWTLNRAEYMRDPQSNQDVGDAMDILKLVTIGRREKHFLGGIHGNEKQMEGVDVPPFELRGFDFVQDTPDEEWTEWNTRMKILVLGTKLNGLKHGPSYNKDRFSRDPDGVCPCIPMS
jgi:hypothetical protein